jgi:hypothetical protein
VFPWLRQTARPGPERGRGELGVGVVNDAKPGEGHGYACEQVRLGFWPGWRHNLDDGMGGQRKARIC